MDILLKRILSLIPDRHGADAAFARSIGYKSGNVIADWRAGRSASYRGKLREIAAVYGVSVEWLCGGAGPAKTPAVAPNEPRSGSAAELYALLTQLTPQEVQRVKDYVAGLLSAR